ncbi:hypothetical protein PsYK624_060160 [Phanerochaete sordida]|uniref:Carbohydrate esterase family 16 protein n=1 Tax=Phanerochaete sordida TaxID=48140 RepID=A0A9P3LCT3_9APHY|nr:hypothetical protein PsYK624_060160 [Phanerochaete sordida]
MNKRKHSPVAAPRSSARPSSSEELGHSDKNSGREKPRSDDSKEASTSTKRRKTRSEPEQNEEGPTPLPCPPSDYLPLALGGRHWRGQRSLRNIVVFGDSYSKSSGSTWVDYLLKQRRKTDKTARAHNFASPGATAEDDLAAQTARFFTSFPKRKTNKPPQLDPDSTTYLLFLGINDCGATDADELAPAVERMVDALHDLYVRAAARNFVLVDVPPVDRSPQAVSSGCDGEIAERVRMWNDLLRAQAAEFAAGSAHASVILFSAYTTFADVLDDPEGFDLGEDDPETEGGGFWEDDLHVTEDMHELLAETLLRHLLPRS